MTAALVGFRLRIHDHSALGMLNPFSTNVSLLYSLKISENLWFSDNFRGYKSEALVENGLKWQSEIVLKFP